MCASLSIEQVIQSSFSVNIYRFLLIVIMFCYQPSISAINHPFQLSVILFYYRRHTSLSPKAVGAVYRNTVRESVCTESRVLYSVRRGWYNLYPLHGDSYHVIEIHYNVEKT